MLQVKNLSKNYGSFEAVKDISFTLNNNEAVALLGLNGAGKTTTLRMLTGFLMPTTGDIYIDNTSLQEQANELKKNIGYLPEKPALYLEMTVEAFLRYMLRLRLQTIENTEEQKIDLALEKAQLKDKKNQVIGSLSMGFKKRVGLAQALVHNPKILIFDEPIADLDPQQIIEVRNLILNLKKEHTIILSSHILSEVAKTADRYLFIHQGKLVAQETKQSLEDKLKDNYQYIVEFEVNQPLTSNEIIAILEQNISFDTNEIVNNTGSYWILDLNSSTDIRSTLSKAIINNNWNLMKIDQKTFDLESLFLNLTNKTV